MAETLRADTETGPGAGAEPKRWYACFTRARAEKRVSQLLEERGVETFLPLVGRVSQWKDRRKRVEWPLFPSYVFGRFALRDAYRVLSVPGVVTLVKHDGRPAAIANAELENVRRFAEALRTGDLPVEPRPFLAEGDRVEVVEGPFAGVQGIVVERRGRKRVVVGIEAIGQGLEIDIDTRLLKPLMVSEGKAT